MTCRIVLLVLPLILSECIWAQYNPYRNPYNSYDPYYQPQPGQDYNQQVYKDTKRRLEQGNMDRRINAMQRQLDILLEEKNQKKHEEDFGHFLNGERFPKARVVEPGIFQTRKNIYVKIPSTGIVVPYSLEDLSKKYVKNGVVIGTVDMFTFEIDLQEVDEAMKKQKIGRYAEEKTVKSAESSIIKRR